MVGLSVFLCFLVLGRCFELFISIGYLFVFWLKDFVGFNNYTNENPHFVLFIYLFSK